MRPGGSEGEPLTAGEHGCCLSCRSWSVPGTSLTKWAFLSGFGILSAIITKTGVLHMAGKPRLVQFSSTSVQFPFPNPSLLRKSTKNHIIWPRDVLGSALCLKKTRPKKRATPNSIVSWCQEKHSAWPRGSSQEVLYLKQPVLVKLDVCWMQILLCSPTLGRFDCCLPE